MEQDNKKIEGLVNKLMTADSLEKAPLDFTDKVMARVEALSDSKSIAYKPLIPKYLWWFIASSFIALLCYFLFKEPTGDTSFLEKFNLPDISFNPLDNLSFEPSNTLMYAVVLFAIMFSIQIPILKQYFNKRLEY
ncbi:hypothetical protein [Winogradskyella haliclonae]|uniref:Uncharacterized protein n=1 Tax=Winogradskyella haliclonae TaxID=2048558 RepID=A0ABQ2BZW1_9FLAO|nr:hypothetical protein [Winogradskyella haliclonae]GGI57087.1 hypothetical protein GCM10011444_13960 [Winogradskyella haliclonae]